jgi:hypothetical protein
MYEESCLHTLTAHFIRQLGSVFLKIYYYVVVCFYLTSVDLAKAKVVTLTEKTLNLHTLSIRAVNLRLRKGTANTLSDKTWNIVIMPR